MTSPIERANVWEALVEAIDDYIDFVLSLDANDLSPEEIDEQEVVLDNLMNALFEPVVLGTIKTQAEYWAVQATISDDGQHLQ